MTPINYAPRYERNLTVSDWLAVVALVVIEPIIINVIFYCIGA